NSRSETFDEFLSRLRESPGHRWDHWWMAELTDTAAPEPAATSQEPRESTAATSQEPRESTAATSQEPRAQPAGAVIATVIPPPMAENGAPRPGGSYVDYIGVLSSARGRGVAKSLLRAVITDAAQRGRDRVGLE